MAKTKQHLKSDLEIIVSSIYIVKDSNEPSLVPNIKSLVHRVKGIPTTYTGEAQLPGKRERSFMILSEELLLLNRDKNDPSWITGDKNLFLEVFANPFK